MRKRGAPWLLVTVAVLLFLVPSTVTYYTDWVWFRELGYEGIFLRSLNAQVMVFGATFAAAYLFLFFNLRAARGSVKRPSVVVGTAPDGRAITVETGQVTGLAMPVSVIVALGIAFVASRKWLMWLSFFHATSFNQADPIFGRDVSFYVFRLPVWESIQQQALLVSFLSLVGCGLYYVLSGSFVIEPRRGPGVFPAVRLVTSARRHIGVLAALVFALVAWGTWFDIPRTLLTPGESVFGAGYVDIHARIPILWITVAVLAAGSGLALFYGFTRRGWPMMMAVGLFVVVWFGGGIYSAFVQRLIVKPDELNRERPYIENNISATRKAYGVDDVEEREVSGDAELTAKDIVSNAGTIENVRLWDHQPLLQTFAQIQEIRTYYDFQNVDNDRYTINGQYRQVMLSARELNTASMQNRTWVNERLIYTHGYGLTLGPVNQVTTEGLPVLFIRDLPPISTADLRVTEPSIYFGELSSNYALVKTKQPELHYPTDEDQGYAPTTYSGSGGVSISGFWRRLLFAIRFTDTDILFTNQLTPESRILYYRRIADRVRVLAPFLAYDADPYPVLSNGRLFWIQDAYTSSRNYPYSRPSTYQGDEINYIRNSVKVVIDAYNGSTTFYLAEPDEAIARTLGRIFPGMLKPLGDMPADLRTHVRYPEDIFKIQTAIYQTYHMTNPTMFFALEDQWQVPVLEGASGPVAMQPYYTMMKLPGEQKIEFIQMVPVTPRLKENLAAWIIARSDGQHYGKLLAFQFPKQSIVFGPKQIVGKINQDEFISPQITLWNQQGSRVIWGTLLVIPINQSLLYVRPLYLQSPEGRIPELKQVVVAYKNRIEMAETLTRALGRIFGPQVTAALAPDRLSSSATSVVMTPADEEKSTVKPLEGTPAIDATAATILAEISGHYEAADKALKSGDMVLWAQEQKKIREAFERLRQIVK